MNILFLHRNFPAQFRHIAPYFALNPNNRVVFITEREQGNMPGIYKCVYKTKRTVPRECHNYLRFLEESVIHGQAAAEVALKLKHQGFKPDIIYGHTWGPTLYMKDIFPDVPLLCYFEWFYNAENSDVDFGNTEPLNINELARVRTKNSHLLIDLYTCNRGTSPTIWQRDQFPKEFHHKIDVIHDGIDTKFFCPDNNAKLIIPHLNLDLSNETEIITYSTRGLEAYRGFPEFMKAVEIILKRRPKAHVVIVGEDRVCYGSKLPDGRTYKQLMLEELDLDLSRVHFTDYLPYDQYRLVLQASKVHVYLTYPFVLSWGMLEAMSTGCCVIGSSTPPVKEVIKNGYNGLLVDFFNFEEIANKIDYVLDNIDKAQEIRRNARQTIVENYNLKTLLPRQIELILNLVTQNNQLKIHK